MCWRNDRLWGYINHSYDMCWKNDRLWGYINHSYDMCWRNDRLWGYINHSYDMCWRNDRLCGSIPGPIIHSYDICRSCIPPGSHGGRGGTVSGSFLVASQAPAYGSTTWPLTAGSGGGSSSDGSGGSGGGLILITATTSITIDGVITCDGTDGTGNSGGGAGGAISMGTLHFQGTGRVSARGGNAGFTGQGGGGGGGRITIKYRTSIFDGDVLAYGGLGGTS